jgi:glycosyltransferase involved in cell wall biosynthesis
MNRDNAMRTASICMLLKGPCTNDSRVDREARTLAGAGYDVRIVATEAPGAPNIEQREGYSIVRVAADPRLAGVMRRVARWFRRILSRGASGEDAGGSHGGGGQTEPTVVGQRAWIAAAGVRSDGDLLLHAPRAAVLRIALRVFLTLRWWRFARSAWCSLRRNPADVYVAHDLDTLPLAAFARSRLGGRIVYDSHELYTDQSATPPASWFWRLRWRMVERALIGRADAVMTVCQSISEELADRYRIARPAVVRNIPELVELDRSSDGGVRTRLGIDSSKRIALYLGGIQLNRPLEHFIDAVEPLSDVVLVLMGPGDPAYVRHLRAYAEDRGCAGRVHLTGPVPSETVVATAREADVGLVVLKRTSLSVWYCLPSKLFESIHAQVPVVANDWPELRRIVEGYGVGVLCESEKAPAITDAIRQLLDDGDGYERMKANASRASEELNWQVESSKIMEVFEAIAPGSGRH